MVELFRRSAAILFAGVVGFAGAASAQPSPTSAPAGDPPARVGRLAFVQGTVSFHDRDQTDWAPAVANTPLTSGDALWTEPNARSEVSIAGTRVRLDSSTQLDMLAVDDTQTRMQLDQGRIDIKTFTYDTHQPYEILTPRGTITLQQQGDYYVEAGSTQDPTRLGVRSGAAQIQAPNGQVLAVRAGEMGEVADDNGSPQLRTIPQAPPPMPTYWAERDRTVVYDQPPQYVTANMTGYEDLNGYGSWSNDPDYGEVWTPRAVVAGWEPYRTGHWAFVQPWGWTWVDDQPWGFAPYHYGRWANRNNHWVWVPPQRDLRPVYAPALVAFVGGVELGVAIGQQSRAPVGWFPLGPREVYVPPYSNDRDYYRRINQSARVQDQVLETRWQQAQRHEAVPANQQQTAFMNRRFATVVPAADFAQSRPVARVALQVAPDKIAAAPVAPVAAPPAPTQSIRAVQAPGTAPNARAPNAPAPAAQAPAAQAATHANVPVTQTRFANMQAIGRPEPTAANQPKAPGPQIATTRANEPNAPSAARPGLPPLAPRTSAAPPQPGQPSTAAKPADTKPADKAVTAPPPAGQPSQPRPPGQANLPPVQQPNANRPVEPPKPQQAQQPAPSPQPGSQAPTQAAPPKPQGAVTPAPQPQATPPKPQLQQAQQPVAPPQPQHQPQPQAEPPKPQGAVTPPPQPQRQAAPQPQPQAPPPPAQAHAPAPPPPAQAHAPAPAPQPQPQAHPAPQQAQAPAPAPQQHAAPPPPQQHPAPQPAPQKKDDEKK